MPQSYLKRDRGYGNGKVRTGNVFRLQEDIYSLGFVSQISNQLIEKHFDVLTENLIEEPLVTESVSINYEEPSATPEQVDYNIN